MKFAPPPIRPPQPPPNDLHCFWLSCNNVAPVTNLCLGGVREHLRFYY